VKEQSHKQEMSAAVRGDFARLRARGVETTIAPDEAPPEATEPASAPAEQATAAEPPLERRSVLRRFLGG
jgi:hypothetical protein